MDTGRCTTLARAPDSRSSICTYICSAAENFPGRPDSSANQPQPTRSALVLHSAQKVLRAVVTGDRPYIYIRLSYRTGVYRIPCRDVCVQQIAQVFIGPVPRLPQMM